MENTIFVETVLVVFAGAAERPNPFKTGMENAILAERGHRFCCLCGGWAVRPNPFRAAMELDSLSKYGLSMDCA